MMKRVSVAVSLIILAVVLAGCTHPAPPQVPTATPVIVEFSAQSPSELHNAQTSVPQPVTTVQVTASNKPVRIFNGEYLWVEYRMNNSAILPPNPRLSFFYTVRMERSFTNYHGIPAIHEKYITISDYSELTGDSLTHVKDGKKTVENLYFTESTDKFLGGTRLETTLGVEKTLEELSGFYVQHQKEDCPAGGLGIIPFSEMNIILIDDGSESVIVPFGTYPDARKYSGKFSDGTPITFWVTSEVPVPIQFQFSDRREDGFDPLDLYELTGWG
ncbi:MAG: DUF3108 domain-containing protein [Methanomicrobiales archaeon]|nr:DUF3108 domain-containing protein [Methanomicrobiales archaeon]